MPSTAASRITTVCGGEGGASLDLPVHAEQATNARAAGHDFTRQPYTDAPGLPTRYGDFFDAAWTTLTR